MQQFVEIISRAKHNPLTKDNGRFHTARGRGRRLMKNAQGALHRSWDIGEKIHVSHGPPGLLHVSCDATVYRLI